MKLTRREALTAMLVGGLALHGIRAEAEDDKPLHFVEKPDMKPQLEAPWLLHKIASEPTEDLDILVPSKALIADLRMPGKVRFRELFDPRYLKQHALIDRDLAYEVTDDTGLHNYHVADDMRTVLFNVDARRGGRELLVVRWVVHEGHLYVSPAQAPDPKTGIFKPWLLKTKLVEFQSPAAAVSVQQPERNLVEKPDKKSPPNRPLTFPVGSEPTEEQLLVASKTFVSAKRRTDGELRFRDFFDPRYLQKHNLTDRDIAVELADSRRIGNLDVANDHQTVLVTIELSSGKMDALLLRWVVHEERLYLSPEKAPDPKTGAFHPWILRTRAN